MAQTRKKRRNAAGSTSKDGEDAAGIKRTRRSRETGSGTNESALAAKVVAAAPHSTSKRHRQDSGVTVEGQPGSHSDMPPKPDYSSSLQHRTASSKQPADAKLLSASEGCKHAGDSEASPSDQQSPHEIHSLLGTLFSQFPQYPTLCLAGPLLVFGRGAGCHVNFRDPLVPQELCQLEVASRSGGEKAVSLKCLAAERHLSVNNSYLDKNQQVLLTGGEEIMIVGSVQYIFTFHLNQESSDIRPEGEVREVQPDSGLQSSREEVATAVELHTEPGKGATDKPDLVQAGRAAMDVESSEAQEVLEDGAERASGVEGDGWKQKVLLAGPGVQQIHISPAEAPLESQQLLDMNTEELPEQFRSSFLQLFGGLSMGLGRGRRTSAAVPALSLAVGVGPDPATANKAIPQQKAVALGDACVEPVAVGTDGVAAELDVGEPGTPLRELDDSTERHTKQVEGFCEELMKLIQLPEDIDATLDQFPHYLGQGTKHRLLSAAFVHLKKTEYARFTAGLSSMSNRILLSGPFGSDIYQETLVRALAKELNAKLLVYDHAQLLLDVSSDEEGDEKGVPQLADSTGTDDEDLDIWATDDDRGDNKGEVSQVGHMASPLTQLPCKHGATASQQPKTHRENTSSPSSTKGWARVQPSSSRAWGPAGPLSIIGRKRRYTSQELLGGSGPRTAQARPAARGSPPVQIFQVGDRVRYIGGSKEASGTVQGPILGLPGPIQGIFCSMQNPGGSRREAYVTAGTAKDTKGPLAGMRGRVVSAEDSKKIGVRFDVPVAGGSNLNKKCEDQYGFYCLPSDLRLDSVDKGEEANAAAIDALVETLVKASKEGPIILFIKDAEKYLTEDMNRLLQLGRRLDGVSGPFLVVGSHTADARRERGNGTGLFGRFGSHPLLELGFMEGMPRFEERSRSEASKGMKYLTKVFSNRITLHAPQDEPATAEWKKMLEQDLATMRERANRTLLKTMMARCGLDCVDADLINIRDQALNTESAEKVVGWATAKQLMSDDDPLVHSGRMAIKADSLTSAVDMLRTTQLEAQPSKNPLKDVATENEFEKRLLSEVIPADEVGVGFDDIGALENVKQTLREVVMLPLQRPELFSRGSLTKPTKGVLLFGPPGTGKTMLAKAVASESGANFINASMSSLASKWFGEGEKYVRALFSLAHKIAPSVIFIDEVDSMLGRRDKTGEHEAMRKIKNEFMSNWDGLRTCERDRVLVLAATNRPMDLDEAVIRRMPRRLFVDLPDKANRMKILKIILKHEDLSPGFDFDELARLTDGDSGSDLHNLCVAAAYRPIRDYLDAERKQQQADAVGAAKCAAPSAGGAVADVQMADAREDDSAKEVCAGPAVAEVTADAAACTADRTALPGESSQGRGQDGGAEADADAVAGASMRQPKASSGPEESAVAMGTGSPAPESGSVRLRPLSMADFKAAMEQVVASVSQDATHMNELRQWNEMYGEGGSRRKSPLPYFM